MSIYRAMRYRAMAVVVCLAGTTAARAQGLPNVPTGTVLSEVMMDVQGSEAQLYGTLLGSSTTPQALSGTSSTDVSGATFSFSLNPGSTYLGQAISDVVQGHFDTTDGSYHWSGAGSSGLGVSWAVTGMITPVAAGGPIIKPNWDLKSYEVTYIRPSVPPKPVYTVTDEVFLSGPGEAVPAVSLKVASSGGLKISVGTDTYDPKTGTYIFQDGWKLPPNLPPGLQFASSFQDVTSGVSPLAGGTGTYTTTINSVPEPSTLVLAAFGMAAGLCVAWRRRRAGAE